MPRHAIEEVDASGEAAIADVLNQPCDELRMPLNVKDVPGRVVLDGVRDERLAPEAQQVIQARPRDAPKCIML